ncbi:DsbA family oxidoreductase [Nakamurella leprariae]|uniref:DsbA family oxidoreductase n=1 Tax=Nakamurella leprariae TaxID=2803911 RepID=A0A938YF55_9ACTN|nr:DsbA family oxidoreductase [Nakamurella leprariae]MBM9468724.1 DsbA family oxidoreductase [Nakamurella leprariae]
MTEAITVDVWTDVVCPWCWIGKRKFEAGLAAFQADGGGPVRVRAHSYELTPDALVGDHQPVAEYFVRKRGVAPAQAQQMLDQVTGIAADVGLEYHFEHAQHTNTRLAHQVLHLAAGRGAQDAVLERLYRAYFCDGRRIGDPAELADLAAEAGLDRDEVLTALRDGTYVADVDADLARARAYGIQGVPFFVLDGRYGVSGAQDPEVFRQALQQVADERVQA